VTARLALLLAVLAAAPLDGQTPGPQSLATIAVAVCAPGHEPRAWVDARDVRALLYTDPQMLEAILVHEESHLQVQREFGSCERYIAWRNRSPLHSLVVEAIAFCAMSRFWAAIGRAPTLAVAIGYWAHNFAAYHGVNDWRHAADMITAACEVT
jgi:hypothetical protein